MTIKLKQPDIITATYRIVTPMFMGDAQQKATGISPASAKGALRFWWRALNWGRVASACHSEKEALKQLHEEEAVLFGSSAYDSENKQRDKEHKALIGASRFTLKLDTSEVSSTAKADWPKGANDPSGYLGIGLWESGSKQKGNFQAARQYLAEDKQFTVKLYSKVDELNDAQMKQLKDALLAWGLFGGLGSRSRRAFGSVAIESIDDQSYKCNTVNDYQEKIESIFQEYRLETIAQPPFSAFSRETAFSICSSEKSKARDSHAHLGQAFKDYRGQPSDMRGEKKRVFGLPYSGGSKQDNEERRASPLLFHIHPIGNKFVSASLYFPATFHPKYKNDNIQFSLAENFLDQLEKVAL